MMQELRIPLAWHWIERVRETVAGALGGHPEELRDAAVMVASELAENLVKYGHPVDGDNSGRITIEASDGVVTIVSENGASRAEAEKVLALARSIEGASDVRALYVARLMSMATAPGDAASELGLLRIAFEGGFGVTAEYDAPRLRLVAKRSTQT